MKYHNLISMIYVFVFLSGCTVIADLQAKNKEKLFNQAKESCLEYGFKLETDAFAGCIQKEVNEIKNRKAIEDASNKNIKAIEDASS